MNMLKTNKQDYYETVGKYNLPPGYSFAPTDEEALKEYVLPKVNQKEKYPGLIKTVDIYQFEPQDLPGFTFQDPSFYFTRRDPLHMNGSRIKRTVNGSNGFWRSNNKVNPVKDSNGVILGKKNSLVYTLKNENGSKTKTDYLMVEYVLDDSRCQRGKVNDVVLCKIYLKKTSKAEEGPPRENEEEVGKMRLDDSLHLNNEQARKEQWCQLNDNPLVCQESYITSNFASTQDENSKRKRQESMPSGEAIDFEAGDLNESCHVQSQKKPVFVFNSHYYNFNVPSAWKNLGVKGPSSSLT